MMLLNVPLWPESASTVSGDVDLLFIFACAVAIVFATLIFFLVTLFAAKYRRRPGHKADPKTSENTPLELTWTAIPLVIALAMFFWGANVYSKLTRVPDEDALEILGVGKQWMWKFQHPTGQSEINTLHVPTGRPVRVTLASEDVIHSFFIPAFRVKSDAVPGRYTSAWFEATKPGSYHLFCAEYCGARHAEMGGWVHVLEPAEYQEWLRGIDSSETPAQAGERLFVQYGCNTCHTGKDGARGPALTGLFGDAVQLETGQRLVADEAYLRESILAPNAKTVANYQKIMPTFQGLISEEGVMQLIAYIKSLEDVDGQETTP